MSRQIHGERDSAVRRGTGAHNTEPEIKFIGCLAKESQILIADCYLLQFYTLYSGCGKCSSCWNPVSNVRPEERATKHKNQFHRVQVNGTLVRSKACCHHD